MTLSFVDADGLCACRLNGDQGAGLHLSGSEIVLAAWPPLIGGQAAFECCVRPGDTFKLWHANGHLAMFAIADGMQSMWVWFLD
jgi:hypothetical protein